MPERRAQARRRHSVSSLNPYLRSVLRSFRPVITAVFVFSFCINLLTLAVPLYLLQIYSKVLPGRNLDTLWYLTALALLAIAALGLLDAVRRSMLSKSAVRFDHVVSEHLLSSAIQRAIVKAYVSVNVLRDLANIRSFIGGSLVFPLLDMPWTPLFIAILFVLHPLLGIIGLLGALIMIALAVGNELFTREPLKQAGQESRDMLEQARAYVANADVVKAMGMQATVNARWQQENTATLGSHYRAGRVTTRFASISKIVRLCLQIGIICAAAWLIVQQQLTAGATIASVLLLRRAIAPLEQSIRSWKSVVSARASLRNISEYLDHADTLTTDSDLPAPRGELEADNLGFKHSGADRSVFSRVRLTLKPGTITVLKGPTGAGKTTLFRLLAGIAPPAAGKITVDGFDMQLWSPAQRARAIGYMPQQVSLFPGTVRENISRLEPAPIDAVVAAAKRANVHKLIQALERGYETEVAPEGGNLSGGQGQAIGLARALFGDPRLVLLDEPDASLDSRSRSRLRRTLRSLRREGVVVLLITHRASLERLADQVLQLEGGRLRVLSSREDAAEEKRPHASPNELESGVLPDAAQSRVTRSLAPQSEGSLPKCEADVTMLPVESPAGAAVVTGTAMQRVASGRARASSAALSLVAVSESSPSWAALDRSDTTDPAPVVSATPVTQPTMTAGRAASDADLAVRRDDLPSSETRSETRSEHTRSSAEPEALQAAVSLTPSAVAGRHMQRVAHKRNRWARQDRRVQLPLKPSQGS